MFFLVSIPVRLGVHARWVVVDLGGGLSGVNLAMLIKIVRFALLACLGCCTASCQESRPISWPDVLSWYFMWMTSNSKAEGTAQCEGQVRSDEAIQFRCGEKVVVVGVGFELLQALRRGNRDACDDDCQRRE